MVTNDTGQMHIGAALHNPVVAMFGPTNPDGTGPYGQRQNVIQMRGLPCVPCMKGHCSYLDPLAGLKNISAAMVLEAARKAMENGALQTYKKPSNHRPPAQIPLFQSESLVSYIRDLRAVP